MKRTTKYVALDVHQATTVVSVREANRRVIARTILPTEASALTEYFSGMRGSVHVAFEEGTQAQWLHDLLTPLVDDIVVCHRRGEHRGNKGDQKDADQIALRLLTGDLRAVYHGSTERITLREFTRTYSNLVEDSTRAMLRLKSLFRSTAIRTTGRRVYSPSERAQWLHQLSNRGARFRAETLYAQIDVLRELRPKAKAAMIAEARRDPAWSVLRSIPFLGPVRVALILATMKTPWRFRTKRNLWAYAGLAVVTQSSSDHEFHAGRPVRRRRSRSHAVSTQITIAFSRACSRVRRRRRPDAPGRSRTSIGTWSCAGCARTWHASRSRASLPHSHCDSGSEENSTMQRS